MDKAVERNIIMEINANPERLDLDDRHSKMAMEKGLKLSVSTDAHSIGDLQNMKYGIFQARRGWLEPQNVVNTLGADDLLKHFGKD